MAGKLQRTIGAGVQQNLGARRDWGHTPGGSSDPEGQRCLERGVSGSGPEIHGGLEPEARGLWGRGPEIGEPESPWSGLCALRGPRPGFRGPVPDPGPRQADQRHSRGPEGADGAHPLDASLRQRERPALRQLHMSRGQPAWSFQRFHEAPECVREGGAGPGRGAGPVRGGAGTVPRPNANLGKRLTLRPKQGA